MMEQLYEGVAILQWGREKRHEMGILNLDGKLCDWWLQTVALYLLLLFLQENPILNRPQVGKDS